MPISGVPVTPNSAAWMDAGLHALAETLLTHDERISVMLLVTGFARWTGIVFAGYDRGARESGLTTEEITVRDDALFRELITADAFPSLREAIDAGVFLDENDPFAFGLARALDGVATYIERIEAGGEREAPRSPTTRTPRAWMRTSACATRARPCARPRRPCATRGSWSGRRCARRASGCRGVRPDGRGCGIRDRQWVSHPPHGFTRAHPSRKVW
ncbi:TetR/AcrR family transcriptional regulator C-terminal domain-containing protein [Microbacterium sp. NIBRBAC000506063]|uniref:TetR/AcrR family transcriptional regulator C-terminal domain-containing protein n=1 Tax=Microbacterium sp. NIBRBAC000506063 TaxID=2734618 RepID=UPI0021D47A6D|nr:TetR/AcrR family transcriptional regulator C-terminal domain-containing protein [Microbacterium sp. NIBRBAC000506063]